MQVLNLLSLKCFSRLRNKAQMFTSLADDHYHTRLAHSIEVEAVAKEIAKRLLERYPDKKAFRQIDMDFLSHIALLHDIGHTPYGHIGERTLNSICSGRERSSMLPDFAKLDIGIGFKHNVNSGILYKESLIASRNPITKYECLVIDGIVKHSSLSFKGQRKLDYGFSYINAGLPKDINFHRSKPATIEGRIVAYADEIAQLFSDYLDLFSGRFDVLQIQSSAPYSFIPVAEARAKANAAVERMVSLFVDACSSGITRKRIANSAFGRELSAFDMARKKTILSNEAIRVHDYLKERNIIILFQHYFNHPSDSQELLEDFKNRALRYDFSKRFRDEIMGLSTNDFDAFVTKELSSLQDERSTRRNKMATKSLLRIFVRSVAIHISKMTDGYADHKVKKIISYGVKAF